VADSAQLILGTNAGKVVLFDLMSGESIAMTKGGHSGRVNGATWGADATTVFTCGDDKQICKWDLGSKTQVKKWKGGAQPVTALTYMVRAAEPDLLISGGLKIKIWDAEELTELTSLRGHAFPICALAPSVNGHVLSCVQDEPDDPLIYMWPTDGESTKPFTTLLPATSPVAVATTEVSVGEARVLAVTTAGALHVFEAVESETPTSPASTLKLMTGDVPSASVEILSAIFTPGRTTTHVLVARGSTVAPVFEHVMYTSEETGEPIDLTLTREGTGSLLMRANPKASKKAAAGGSAAAATVTCGTDGLKLSNAKRKKGKHADEAEPSLADQVQALQVATGGAGSALPLSGAAPRAGSLAHMLAQALHSNDKSLLEDCLNNTNEGTVRNTVMRLPPTLAVRFLTDVVGRLEAKPSRGVTLMVWIRAVLLIHSSYLMTVPDLPNILSGLYNLIDARLAVFPQLLKLSGRLDLLLSQIALKSQAAPGGDAAELQVPITSFVDEESDLEDDDEDGEEGAGGQGWEDEDDDDMSDDEDMSEDGEDDDDDDAMDH
jgi:U3 small nucleolar RNA-associated protein 5